MASEGSSQAMAQLEGFNSVYVGLRENNEYVILSPSKQVLFNAKKDPKFSKVDDGSFHIQFLDERQIPVISIHRPSTSKLEKMEVELNGSLEFMVRSKVFRPFLYICNMRGRCVRVKIPFIKSKRATYEIFIGDYAMGYMKKEWGGIGHYMNPVKDDFLLVFPPDMRVELKSALIGTCILIIKKYFKES